MKKCLAAFAFLLFISFRVDAQIGIPSKCINGNCQDGEGVVAYGNPVRATLSAHFSKGKLSYGPCKVKLADGTQLIGEVGDSEGWQCWLMNASVYDRDGNLLAKNLNEINYIKYTPYTIYGEAFAPMLGFGYSVYVRFVGKDDQIKAMAFNDYYVSKREDLNKEGDPRSATYYAFNFTKPQAYYFNSQSGELLKTGEADGYEGTYRHFDSLVAFMRNIVPDSRWSAIQARDRGDEGCTVLSSGAYGFYFYDVPDKDHPAPKLLATFKNKDVVHIAGDDIGFTPSFDGKLVLIYGSYKGKNDEYVHVGYILDLANGAKKLMDRNDKTFNDVNFKSGQFSNSGDTLIFYSNNSNSQAMELRLFNLKSKKWIGTKTLERTSYFGYYSPDFRNLSRAVRQAPFPNVQDPFYLYAINGNATLALYVNNQSVVIRSINYPDEWKVLNYPNLNKAQLAKQLQQYSDLMPYNVMEQEAYDAWVRKLVAAREAYYRQFEAEQAAKVRSQYHIPVGKTICSRCHGRGIINVSGGRQSVQETPDIDVYEVDKMGNKKLVKTIYGHYNQVDIINSAKCPDCGGKGYY